MKEAAQPFEFLAVSYLTKITNWKATNLLELQTALEKCSDASIFYHTFQSLHRHHFLTEGFSNDFAQWAFAALNRTILAEQLAALDIRDYMSIAELRADLRRVVSEDSASHPDMATQSALETFYFCESVEVTVPLQRTARNLEEFRAGLSSLGHSSLHYHFIASRLARHLRMNDFSYWFQEGLGIPALADRANHIDIYTNTLDSVREKLLATISEEIAQ